MSQDAASQRWCPARVLDGPHEGQQWYATSRQGAVAVLGSRANGFAMYAVTPSDEWDADGETVALRFVRFVEHPLPHAAWIRQDDDLEHATAGSSDHALCGLTDGGVYRHLFEDVPTDRRCKRCEAEVEREATRG